MHPRTTQRPLASLPWYDLLEVRPATDALWSILAGKLKEVGFRAAPEWLDRGVPHLRQWRSGVLLFGQACGYDALLAHRHHLQLLATPRYAAPGCRGSRHRSFVVVREDAPFRSLQDLQGSRCTYNNRTSHSGRNALRSLVAPFSRGGRFFASVTRSGSHLQSLRRIRGGRADVASVDCVTHALLARHAPGELQGTRILACTRRVPAPPFVTAAGRSPEECRRLRWALAATLADPASAGAREELLLQGAAVLPLEAYAPLQAMERLAEAHGYHELAP